SVDERRYLATLAAPEGADPVPVVARQLRRGVQQLLGHLEHLPCVVLGATTAAEASTPATPTTPIAAADAAPSVTVRGLDSPESVVHDPLTDTYLVSNIGGELPAAATAKDGNGFISRVAPDGRVLDRAWIGLGRNGVAMNAPKGLALSGRSIFVADIDVVREFDRRTGAPIRAIEVPGAVFLNDVARWPAGGVVVSDSALVPNADGTGFDAGDGDAIYRIDARGRLSTVAAGPSLDSPNGLTVDRHGLLLAVSVDTSNEVYTIVDGERRTVRRTPVGQLDGLEVLGDGSFLVSSFGESTTVRVPRQGAAETLLAGRTAADLGVDRCRARVLLPLLLEDELLIQPL
ncbi:MAG: hypothetical protein ACRCYR_03395, partial [Phycicoccus sp.]